MISAITTAICIALYVCLYAANERSRKKWDRVASDVFGEMMRARNDA